MTLVSLGLGVVSSGSTLEAYLKKNRAYLKKSDFTCIDFFVSYFLSFCFDFYYVYAYFGFNLVLR